MNVYIERLLHQALRVLLSSHYHQHIHQQSPSGDASTHKKFICRLETVQNSCMTCEIEARKFLLHQPCIM